MAEGGNISWQNDENFRGQFKRNLKDRGSQSIKDVSNTRKCPECDGKITKKSCKSKSRVWRKVMWFTRKSKSKNDICDCQSLDEELEDKYSSSWSFTRSASRKFRISSWKRQGKSESLKNRVNGKREDGWTSSKGSIPSVGTVPSRGSIASKGSVSSVVTCSVCSSATNSPTATGSFCDFGASSQSREKGLRRHVVLTEIAREINPPAVNHVSPLHDVGPPKKLSKSSSSISHILRCPQNPGRVRRSKSFPGYQSNMFPSKRRVTNSSNKLARFSPPLKLQCFGLRRTTTFCGKLDMEFPKLAMKKSKSENTSEMVKRAETTSSGEIRDQCGCVVGVVHFYKSPKKMASRVTSFNRKRNSTFEEANLLCRSDQIRPNLDLNSIFGSQKYIGEHLSENKATCDAGMWRNPLKSTQSNCCTLNKMTKNDNSIVTLRDEKMFYDDEVSMSSEKTGDFRVEDNFVLTGFGTGGQTKRSNCLNVMNADLYSKAQHEQQSEISLSTFNNCPADNFLSDNEVVVDRSQCRAEGFEKLAAEDVTRKGLDVGQFDAHRNFYNEPDETTVESDGLPILAQGDGSLTVISLPEVGHGVSAPCSPSKVVFVNEECCDNLFHDKAKGSMDNCSSLSVDKVSISENCDQNSDVVETTASQGPLFRDVGCNQNDLLVDEESLSGGTHGQDLRIVEQPFRYSEKYLRTGGSSQNNLLLDGKSFSDLLAGKLSRSSTAYRHSESVGEYQSEIDVKKLSTDGNRGCKDEAIGAIKGDSWSDVHSNLGLTFKLHVDGTSFSQILEENICENDAFESRGSTFRDKCMNKGVFELFKKLPTAGRDFPADIEVCDADCLPKSNFKMLAESPCFHRCSKGELKFERLRTSNDSDLELIGDNKGCATSTKVVPTSAFGLKRFESECFDGCLKGEINNSEKLESLQTSDNDGHLELTRDIKVWGTTSNIPLESNTNEIESTCCGAYLKGELKSSEEFESLSTSVRVGHSKLASNSKICDAAAKIFSESDAETKHLECCGRCLKSEFGSPTQYEASSMSPNKDLIFTSNVKACNTGLAESQSCKMSNEDSLNIPSRTKVDDLDSLVSDGDSVVSEQASTIPLACDSDLSFSSENTSCNVAFDVDRPCTIDCVGFESDTMGELFKNSLNNKDVVFESSDIDPNDYFCEEIDDSFETTGVSPDEFDSLAIEKCSASENLNPTNPDALDRSITSDKSGLRTSFLDLENTNHTALQCSKTKCDNYSMVGSAGVLKRSSHEPLKRLTSNVKGNYSGKVASPELFDELSKTPDHASVFDNKILAQQSDVPIHTWKTSESSDMMNTDEIGLPVPGQKFKMRTELILSWFEEFNDEQRNMILKKILNRCDLPQMHLLSVAMENNLHKTCPPNCQDMLVWLPYTVTLKILMYLDPVSLCRCNQVNRAWNELTDNSSLWQRLTRNPDYQLSEASSKRQFKKFTYPNGEIHWKKVFAERFLLQRNWLNGTYKLRTFEGHNQGIACVQFDDTRIVSGSSDKTIKLWDISNTPSELMLTLEGHSGTVRCLDLNGNRLVSGSTDRTIKVWDLSFASYWAGASCKVTMVGHLHTVRCLQADETKLVSGSYDKTVKVWDLKTGQCQLTLRGHTAAVLCVQFDDQKIVSGSYDKKIKVWDLKQGACLMTLDGHQDAVTCLNLTHDGMKIITGSLDYSLKFWDLSTGKCYGTLDWITSEGHTAVVRCLQVDSWRIVSGGDDKTLKVWELATGQRLLTLRYHSDGVTCMQFNDFAIVSGSYDRTVKLWDFSPKHPYLETIS